MKSTGEKHILSIGSLVVALGGKGLQSQFWHSSMFHRTLIFQFRTVDGIYPANQLRLVVYPIIYKVLYIPSGDRRISEPSTVCILNQAPGWKDTL